MAVFRVVFLAAIIVALGNWLTRKALDRASNRCKMTFSTPKFVPVPVAGYPGRDGDGEIAGENPGYGYGYRLMRYIDRKLPASDKAEPLEPRGTPVLFVPGHLGKYDQVCVFVRVLFRNAIAWVVARCWVFVLRVLTSRYPCVAVVVGRKRVDHQTKEAEVKPRAEPCSSHDMCDRHPWLKGLRTAEASTTFCPR